MSDLSPFPFPAKTTEQHTHPRHPLDLNELLGHTEDIRTALLTPAPPSPTTIDPDDAAVVGVSTLWAKGDHQHAISTVTPADLTKTATSAEGAGVNFARGNHVHATSALPWGIVARQTLTADSIALSGNFGGSAGDWFLDEVPVDVTRAYVVGLTSMCLFTTGGQWNMTLREDGVNTDTLWQRSQVGAGQLLPIHIRKLWLPATGTPDLAVVCAFTAGGASTFQWTYTNSGITAIRYFWVEDIGPR